MESAFLALVFESKSADAPVSGSDTHVICLCLSGKGGFWWSVFV